MLWELPVLKLKGGENVIKEVVSVDLIVELESGRIGCLKYDFGLRGDASVSERAGSAAAQKHAHVPRHCRKSLSPPSAQGFESLSIPVIEWRRSSARAGCAHATATFEAHLSVIWFVRFWLSKLRKSAPAGDCHTLHPMVRSGQTIKPAAPRPNPKASQRATGQSSHHPTLKESNHIFLARVDESRENSQVRARAGSNFVTPTTPTTRIEKSVIARVLGRGIQP